MRLKKGDEVRSHRDCPFGGVKTGDIFTITAVDGDLIMFVDNDGNSRLRPDDEFELLPVADATGKPALTIETGKFYRTRDGRKVGPYEHSFSNIWIAGKGNHSTARFADGRISHHHESPGDLIAEWVDEPNSNDNAPATTPAIVVLIEGGQPKPSEQPKVHKSEQAAADEAERLAVKYPGQKFGVFVLADSRIADVVIRRAA